MGPKHETPTQRVWSKAAGFTAGIDVDGGMLAEDLQEGKRGNGGGRSVAGPE